MVSDAAGYLVCVLGVASAVDVRSLYLDVCTSPHIATSCLRVCDNATRLWGLEDVWMFADGSCIRGVL
jgi:hypothetical protein